MAQTRRFALDHPASWRFLRPDPAGSVAYADVRVVFELGIGAAIPSAENRE